MSWPGAVAVRPVLAVAGDRAVDEARVLLAQALVADAEAVEHARAERLEQHVGVADQPQQHLLAGGRLEVDPDRALAPVERQEQGAAGARLGALVVRRRPADVVAEPGVLDLDHVGAEVREQQRAEPAGQQSRQVEDPQAVERERPGHAAAPPARGARCRAARAPPRPSPGGARRPRSSAAPSRSGRRWSAPSRRRGGRSCPRARRGSSRRASAPPRPASTGRGRSRSRPSGV